MAHRAEPAIVTTIGALGDAVFDGLAKLYLGFFYSILVVGAWIGICGFGLMFIVNTVGFEAGVPDANLADSNRAALATTVSYGMLKLLRAGRGWLQSST